MRIFGFQIGREAEEEKSNNEIPSFSQRETDDGALVVSAGGAYGTFVDFEGSAKTESDLVAKYRDMSIQPECEAAINNIVDTSIVKEGKEKVVSIDLDDLEVTDQVKDKIREAWSKVDDLFDFNNSAYDIFRRWYIDGRIYYHIMIDTKEPDNGIQELRYIDPRKIRKVRSIKRVRKGQLFTNVTDSEFYMFNEKGFKGTLATGSDNQGLKISKDSIIHVTSGIVDKDYKLVLGYLHKAIKCLNQLRMLEDATVIYRISRAPERRIFSIDVGNLPKMKAEQYVKDVMIKHKNRLIYDATTGSVRDDRKFMTMLEDYWFPRREGGGGTQVTTLPSGQNLGEMADVEYFERKLYQSLNVPVSRLQPDTGFNVGRSSEITRDELDFQKFIMRLRLKFSGVLAQALKVQLILTKVITDQDWEEFKNKIHFNFATDNYFSELKDEEIIRERINTLSMVDPYVGKYYSKEWVMKNILQLEEEEIDEMEAEMAQELQIQMEQQMEQQQLQGGAPGDQQDGDQEAQPGQPGLHPSEPQLSQ